MKRDGLLPGLLTNGLSAVHRGEGFVAPDTSYRSADLAIAKQQSDKLGLTGRRRDRGHVLGTPHLLPRAGRAGGERIQGSARVPPERLHRSRRRVSGMFPVLSTPEGLKRFVTIKDSPYHGLNLCLGVLSEMMENPAEDIFEPLTGWRRGRRSSTSTSATSRATATTTRRCARRGRGGLHARGATCSPRTATTVTSRRTTT